jgi:putative nucleotidyltransferase with HDIG domain
MNDHVTHVFDPVEIRRKIFSIEQLGALPHLVWHLMDALMDERTTASDLERLIESDMALASKVLSLANSAYYRQTQSITTIQRAVVVIGFTELHLLAVAAGLSKLFDTSRLPAGIDGEGLWLHGLAVSWVARKMAEYIGFPAPCEVMVAGLLHDLGKLVLVSHLTEEFEQIAAGLDRGLPYYLAEKQTGLSHTRVGYWLARRWQLPEIFGSVILHHHQPYKNDPHLPAVALVFLANRMVLNLGIGWEDPEPGVDESVALEATGFHEKQLTMIQEEARQKLPQQLAAWKSILNGGLSGH